MWRSSLFVRADSSLWDTDKLRFTWGGPAATKTLFYDFFVCPRFVR